MTDQGDSTNLGKIVLTTKIKRGNLEPVWDKPVPYRCVSVPTFCLFVDRLWLLLEISPFKNL